MNSFSRNNDTTKALGEILDHLEEEAAVRDNRWSLEMDRRYNSMKNYFAGVATVVACVSVYCIFFI